MNTYKLLLFVISGFLIISGISVAIAGGLSRSTLSEFEKIYEGGGYGVNAIILLGLFLILLGILSGFGAFTEISFFIFIFCILLAAIIVLELITATVVFFISSKSEGWIKEAMKESSVDYNKSDSQEITSTWDQLHKAFSCCGVTGIENWKDHQYVTPGDAPDSCCKTVTTGCGRGMTAEPKDSDVYVRGCVSPFTDIVKKMLRNLSIFALALSALQSLAVIIAFKATSEFT